MAIPVVSPRHSCPWDRGFAGSEAPYTKHPKHRSTVSRTFLSSKGFVM